MPSRTAAGSYVLIACVDRSRRVKETNERNNCRASRTRTSVGGGDGGGGCVPAPDKPDLAFVDQNCDGIDGDASKALFVSVAGSDRNPGTREQPQRSVNAAVAAASGSGRDVYVTAGSYDKGSGVAAAGGVGIYGGYSAANWSRSVTATTTITGSPQALLADGDAGRDAAAAHAALDARQLALCMRSPCDQRL